MGIFSGANESELTGQRGASIRDYLGEHIVKVSELKAGLSKGKKKGRAYFAADFEVLKSNNPKLKKGTKAGWVTMRHPEWPDFFYSDIKRCLAAATGRGVDKITEAAMDRAVSAEQPAAGKVLGIEVFTKFKDDGEEIAECQFFAADLETELGELEAEEPEAPETAKVSPAPAGAAGDAQEDPFGAAA